VIEMYAFASIALVVSGVVIGVFVMVCLGISRDDRPGGFPAATNDRMARAARRVTRAGIRRPESADGASRRRSILAA
jgi:hypothetical protein